MFKIVKSIKESKLRVPIIGIVSLIFVVFMFVFIDISMDVKNDVDELSVVYNYTGKVDTTICTNDANATNGCTINDDIFNKLGRNSVVTFWCGRGTIEACKGRYNLPIYCEVGNDGRLKHDCLTSLCDIPCASWSEASEGESSVDYKWSGSTAWYNQIVDIHLSGLFNKKFSKDTVYYCAAGNSLWGFESCDRIPVPPPPDPEKTKNKCTVDEPNGGNLECNGNKTLESTCDHLTIVVEDKYVDVTIEQKGYISSVLTPDNTYAGAGFNFGVTYTNTVKWSYVDGVPSSTLHNAITSEMNMKLKDYNSYIAGLNLSEIVFGDNTMDSSFLVKKCTTSNSNIDYYNKELSVSCTFYLPDSVLEETGKVIYSAGIGNSVSNKYYTPTNFDGDYKIEAKIVGMSRITDNSSSADSADGKSWTGSWVDTFSNCKINIYPLLYKKGDSNDDKKKEYNFIYRPIDIYNPFPNRNAGINWFDWYNVENNIERLESTYDSNKLQYKVTLNNQTIASIKEYNKDSNYLDWGSIADIDKSDFIDDYFDIKRENLID